MVDHPYKELFYQPSVNKQWIITGTGLNITNSDIDWDDGLTIEEALCSHERLMFGSCEASSISFTVRGFTESLVGQYINVSLVLNGDVENIMPIGSYRITKDTPSADRRYRKIEAHDALYFINNDDCTYWYDHLTFPMTVKAFRDSFFNHFQTPIIQETITLQNDDILINKTINSDYGSISGNTIITAICEMNGCFGHMGRDGKFHYVFLREIIPGLYPANDLYPADDLYPAEESVDEAIAFNRYRQVNYEDYECQHIDKVTVINDEGAIIATVGNGVNNYYMNNPLLYDKTAAQATSIINRIFNLLYLPLYWPCVVDAIGNLCLEVGDSIRINGTMTNFYTYILQRTMKGLQRLEDTYISEGEEIRSERINSVSSELMENRALSASAQDSADRADAAATRAEETATTAANRAESAQSAAESAASSASASASSAQQAVSTAQAAASQASTAASNASAAATRAETAANTANTAANGANNARDNANGAAGSATSAAGSATSAAGSATSAAGSANSAANRANAAADAAQNMMDAFATQIDTGNLRLGSIGGLQIYGVKGQYYSPAVLRSINGYTVISF